MQCQCQAAGHCQVFRREMNAREHQLCAGVNCTPEQTAKYRALWKRQAGPQGLGDVIESVTTATGIKAVVDAVSAATGVDCGCNDRKDALNKWWPFHSGSPTVAESGWRLRWAVGITTAPRGQWTLPRAIGSLCTSGFDRMTIFAEPGSPIPGLPAEIDVVERPKRLGIHHNYVESLRDLLQAHPQADTLAIFQDDVIVCRHLREFLDADLWPAWNCGVVSAYSPNFHGYEKSHSGGCHRVSQAHLIGACAMVFPRHAAEMIVKHPLAESWRGRAKGRANSREDRKAVDAFIGHVVRQIGLRSYFYSPSLVQHVARVSTVRHGGATGKRRSAGFPGEQADAREQYRPAWVSYDLPSGDQRYPVTESRESRPVSVVIPAKDSADLTAKCLEHIACQDVELDVIYVDNGSTPGIVDAIRETGERLSLDLRIIENTENLGYTRANNQGIELAGPGRHVLLLNNDCFLGEGCLASLRWHIENHPKVGIVGPLTGDRGSNSLRNESRLRHSGLLQLPTDLLDADGIAQQLSRRWVAQERIVSFFCALLNADAVAEIGGLTERPGLMSGLGADDEWCQRAGKTGWKVLVDHGAYAAHIHSETFRRLNLNRKALQREAVRELRRAGA